MKSSLKKRALHRAKILEGQMKALTKAIDAEKYCVDLLNQSLSLQRSLKSLDAVLLENHIRTHVKHQLRTPADENRAVAELLRVFTLSKKQ